MKNFYMIFGAGVTALTLCAQQAPAGDQGPSKAPQSLERSPAKVTPFNIGSSVIGMIIKDSAGNEVGKVQDLVLDLANGKIGYAVIALTGASDRMIPVPMRALKPGDTRDHLVLNMSQAVMAAAPSIRNDEWPALDVFAVGGPAVSESGSASSENAEKPKTQ